MSDYDSERDMADVALDHADLDFSPALPWTRADRIAEAQVHATLAVAAAVAAGRVVDGARIGGCVCVDCRPGYTGSERADEARR